MFHTARDPSQRARLRVEREQLIRGLKALNKEIGRAPADVLLQAARDAQRKLDQVNKALGPGYAFAPSRGRV